jgi:hypothetical protein
MTIANKIKVYFELSYSMIRKEREGENSARKMSSNYLYIENYL